MKKNTRADAVYAETAKRLHRLLSTDPSTIKANLAELRRGIGGTPGDDPRLWGMVFDGIPEAMLGKNGRPSKEEWAICNALTLYAVHQQGNDPLKKNMNMKGVSLGRAACRLVYAGENPEEERDRISRRFNQIALAEDIEALTYYLRTFIPILRGKDIGLDYPMLAQDIYLCQSESGRSSVRLRWGQDYYSVNQDKEENYEQQ